MNIFFYSFLTLLISNSVFGVISNDYSRVQNFHTSYKSVEENVEKISGFKANPLAKRLNSLIEENKSKLKSPLMLPLNALFQLQIGEEPLSVVEYYQNLINDAFGAICTTNYNHNVDVGSGAFGYCSAGFLFTNQRLLDLSTHGYYQAAIERSKAMEQGHDITFEHWKTFFATSSRPHGDTINALLGLTIPIKWVDMGFYLGRSLNANVDLPKSSIIKKVFRYTDEDKKNYKKLSGSREYFTGSLYPQIFGVEFIDGRELGNGAWGNGYKSSAGILLSLFLWDKGYHPADIVWAVRFTNLGYETSDFLYDHLNVNKGNQSQIRQIRDNPNSVLGNYWRENIFPQLKLKVSNNKKLQGELVQAIVGINNPLINRFQDLLNIDFNSELNLVAGMIALMHTNESYFNKEFENIFQMDSKAMKIKKIIYGSVRDLTTMTKAASFTASILNIYRETQNKSMLIKFNLPEWNQFIINADKATSSEQYYFRAWDPD